MVREEVVVVVVVVAVAVVVVVVDRCIGLTLTAMSVRITNIIYNKCDKKSLHVN
jgi:hypothetical protein